MKQFTLTFTAEQIDFVGEGLGKVLQEIRENPDEYIDSDLVACSAALDQVVRLAATLDPNDFAPEARAVREDTD